MRLPHRFSCCLVEPLDKWLQVRGLAVGSNRHERGNDVDHDAELLSLRRLGNGAVESATDDVDVAIIPRIADLPGDRRAVHANIETGLTFVEPFGPCLDNVGDFSEWSRGPEPNYPGAITVSGIRVEIVLFSKSFSDCCFPPLSNCSITQ